MGGWWVADNSSYCGGPRYYMDCNATCTCDERLRQRLPLLRAGLRRDRLRLRPAGLRLLPDRLPAVPLRPVQPGRRLHGPHRLPGRRLRPALDGRPLLHHRRRRRQRHGGAERAVLDAGPADAAVHLARHELPGRRHGRRVPTAAATPCSPSFGTAVRLRGLPERRRRRRTLALDAPIVAVATCPTGGYFLAARRRRHLRLRRGAVPRLHGRAAARTRPIVGMAATPSGQGYWLVAADGGIFAFGDAAVPRLHGRAAASTPPVVGMAATPVGPGLLARRRRRRHLRLRRRRRSSAPWAGSTSTSRSSAWRPRRRARATGSSPPTAASSPSATPSSTDRPAPSASTSPWSAWPPYGNDAGYWLVAKDGGIFAFGGAPFLGSPA